MTCHPQQVRCLLLLSIRPKKRVLATCHCERSEAISRHSRESLSSRKLGQESRKIFRDPGLRRGDGY